MIFNIAFMTSFRSSEMYRLKSEDVMQVQYGGESAFRIVGKIGSIDGASKNAQGGLKHVNEKPKEVIVWNRDQLNGLVNVYKDIEEYKRITEPLRSKTKNFFLAVNYHGRQNGSKSFFKASNLGKNCFVQYVKDACEENGIIGTGTKLNVTMHGLRGTVITQLSEAGHADSSVALRNGHRCIESIKAYQNLRGTLGKRQQQDILGGNVIQKTTEVSRAKDVITVDENTDPNEVGTPAELTNEDGSMGVPLDLKMLSSVGTLSGSVTINVNYFGAERKGLRNTFSSEDE